MPIELNIRVISPLTPDDHELLSGIAVMTLAVANHELAKTKFPEAFGDEEDGETPVREIREAPSPCAYVSPDDADLICAGVVGHRGRHKFRRIPVDADTALPN
jgi:hypothetical protein